MVSDELRIDAIVVIQTIAASWGEFGKKKKHACHGPQRNIYQCVLCYLPKSAGETTIRAKKVRALELKYHDIFSGQLFRRVSERLVVRGAIDGVYLS